MILRDVEMFLDACEMKGLSTKTVGSYEQTLRLFVQHLDKNEIADTEDVTHLVVQGYNLKKRLFYDKIIPEDRR